MSLHRLRSKREAVDFALRRLVEDPLPLEEARSMRAPMLGRRGCRDQAG